MQRNNGKAERNLEEKSQGKDCFSAAFRGKDSYEINFKVSKLNEPLSETLPRNCIDLIGKNSILFRNLKMMVSILMMGE